LSGERERFITRRRFLTVLTSGVIGTLIASKRAPWTTDRSVGRPAHRLTMLFADAESAKAIGRAYLHITPGESNPYTLLSALRQDVPGLQRALRLSPDKDLRHLLALNCMEDFARSRTVELDGWIVARTEARLCAFSAVH
jgi:hypothetical protein